MQLRHILAATVLGLALPMGAIAGDDHADRVVKTLNLSGDKADRVEDILEDFHDQKHDLMENTHDQISDLADEKDAKLKAVLTDEEYKQYEELRETKKEMKKKWKKDHRD